MSCFGDESVVACLISSLAAARARSSAVGQRWLYVFSCPEEWPKADSDYVVNSKEAFARLAQAIAELTARGIDTNDFDALWKSDNPF